MAKELVMNVVDVRWPNFQVSIDGDKAIVWDGDHLVGVLVNNPNGWAEVVTWSNSYIMFAKMTTERVYQQLTETGLWAVGEVKNPRINVVK